MNISLPTVPEWVDRAACTEADARAFFPERDGRQHGSDARTAKAICSRCLVRLECLTYGLDEVHGIWGGLTHDERAKLLRSKGAA